MRSCGLACGLAAVLVLAGCGSSATKNRREAVNAYFAAVQHAQSRLAGRQSEIDTTLAGFTLTRPSAEELTGLRRGRATVDAALARVRRVRVPSDATRVQRLVQQRLLAQRGLFDELIQTELDVNRLAAAGPRLHAAAVRLRADLAAAAAAPASTAVAVARGTPLSARERYAQAFGHYGDTLRPVVPALAPAAAPSLLLPTLRDQRSALARSVALSDAIRRDLQQTDIPKANRDIHSLLVIAASLNGAATRRGEARAARAYDAKIAHINTLDRQLARERERLVQEIG
ncbi:MAG TPA: hypothetical protein VGQ38_05705 [Gaiellaceae bacterium]|jgi:hypothetical protein|nr:hypothetical protein [Gaiellaceae bacterium]